jgi:uncharacterized protein (TIGR03435 family)
MTIQHIELCLVAVLAFGQAPPERPEFEVASIKPSASAGVDRVQVGVHIDGSQVSCASLSLKEYIAIAYRVKNYQVSGPDWISSERFDITAKLPAAGAAKDVPVMLQALLEDRFQMKMHRESRDFPVYAMVAGKNGLKLQESAPDSGKDSQSGGPGGGGVNVAASGERRGVSINYGNGSYFTFADDKLEGKKLTAAAMADVLARFSDRPVVNMTNLKGEYDFLLELSPEDFRAMLIRSAVGAGVALSPRALQLAAAASGDSLFNAMEKLGLKLESRKAPVEVLVIDHIEKMPTEN